MRERLHPVQVQAARAGAAADAGAVGATAAVGAAAGVAARGRGGGHG